MTESASRSTESNPLFMAPVQAGQIVAEKYVVERELGRGGMGVVFAASDTLLRRPVALKVLLPGLATSQTAAQRFTREARAASRITSEHVVKLLDIDSLPDGTPVLVMEYLEGRDLRAVLRDGGPLAAKQAVDYLLQALQAVAEGHLHGIVHRDLKPSNLFITERADGTPLIKVLDFGIAKTLEPEAAESFALTGSEDIRLGSPTYMPPEQLHSPRDVDSRADIWALGITLHELVTGSPPFSGQTFADLVFRISSSAPDSLESKRQGTLMPVGLSDVVAKCLEKNRDRRYANAAELAKALAPFGSDDARLSLSRVMGLTRVRTIPAVPDSGARDSSGTCETTLPVPVELGFERAHTDTSSGARRVAPPPRRNGKGLLLSGIAAAAILSSVIWRQTQRAAVHAPAAQPPIALESRLSALETAAARPTPAPVPSAPPTPATLTSAALNSAPAPSAPQPAPRSNVKAGKSVPPSASVSSASPRTSSASHEGSPAVPAGLANVEAPTTGEIGPSPLIESLIEKRH